MSYFIFITLVDSLKSIDIGQLSLLKKRQKNN